MKLIISLIYWFFYFLTFYFIINESWISALTSLVLVWIFDEIKEIKRREEKK